jgi:hypothetical protein
MRQTFSKHSGPDAQNCARCCRKCKREHFFFFFILPRAYNSLGETRLSQEATKPQPTGLGTRSLGDLGPIPNSATSQLCDLGKVISLSGPQLPYWENIAV